MTTEHSTCFEMWVSTLSSSLDTSASLRSKLLTPDTSSVNAKNFCRVDAYRRVDSHPMRCDTPSRPQKQETREEPPCLLPAGLEGDGCSRRATPWWRPPRQPHRGRCAIPIEAAAPCLDEAAAPCPGGAAGPLVPRCPRRRLPRRSPRAGPGGGRRAGAALPRQCDGWRRAGRRWWDWGGDRGPPLVGLGRG